MRIKRNQRCARVLAGKRLASSLPARTRAHRLGATGCIYLSKTINAGLSSNAAPMNLVELYLYSEATGAEFRFKLTQVSLVLYKTAGGFHNHLLIELGCVQYDQRRGPVERLGDAWNFCQIQFSDCLNQTRKPGRKRLADRRNFGANDLQLLFE